MANFEVIDREDTALVAMLDKLLSGNTIVKVGIVQDSVGGLDPNDEKIDSDATIGEVARIHEYGTDTIPQRSFLRSTFDEERNKLQLVIIKLAKAEINSSKNPSVNKVLSKVGAHMVGRVVWKFTNNNWPRLKDPTRGGRNPSGSATPLVDTGQLRRSIGYKIEARR